MNENSKKTLAILFVLAIIISSVFGAGAGFLAGVASDQFNLPAWFEENILKEKIIKQTESGDKIITMEEESAVIAVVDKVSPAVVSIIVSKDLPKIEQYNPFGDDFFRQFFGDGFSDFFSAPQYRQNGTEKQEIGGGTGFFVSSDGYIVTNKHVVYDETAEYTVLMNDEIKYEARILARDSVTDLAILKVDVAAAKAAGKKADNFPTVELGDSANLKVGQTVIAIGNALGEFRNTVSTGVISGLSRSITASGAGIGGEQLAGVIQTDASINPGNSGGPLLDIAGRVIGINTAIVQNAQNIGFAIPINEVKNTIESVKKNGRIIRPWLGVRYVQINKLIADANQLKFDYGALIMRGQNKTDLAVIPGSPADKAGLTENDIILEVNGKKIDEDNPLAKALSKFKVGEEITLKVFRKGKEENIKVKLEEMK